MPEWKDFIHRTGVRVRFGDTDPYGIVYFVSYFRYCHRAIEEYLRAVGLAPEETFRNVAEGFGLPVVEAHCRFLRPAKYGETLEVATRIAELRPKAVIFAFEFYRPGEPTLLACGSAHLVTISRDWRAMDLPERVRERLAGGGSLSCGAGQDSR